MATEQAANYGAPWSRDELVLALYLYCQLPFARTKATNPDVMRLAKVLKRSPSSIARKLGNFGAFDPSLAQQGITGLTHFSKADKAVWEEFNGRWDRLVVESQKLLGTHFRGATQSGLARKRDDEAIISGPKGPSESPRTVMARLHQTFFRRAVLSSYDCVCCVCGLDLPRLLVASHIVPWSVSPKTRANPQNGLCLCALHDKAYDVGIITISSSYEVVVSSSIRSSRAPMSQYALVAFIGQTIRKPHRFMPRPEYLEWHMKNVFHV